MSLRILACLLVTGLLSMGCAHGIEVRSEPPGAQVFVEGEPAGVTPMVLETTTGQVDATTVEVRQGDVSARFAVVQSEWAPAPLLTGVGLGLAGIVGGTAVAIGGYGLVFAPIFTGNFDPNLLWGSFGIGMTAYALGLLAASQAIWAPFVVAELYGRKGPDAVFVDFVEGEVHSEPVGQIEPLVGLPPGQRPLRWRDEEE